LNSLEAINDLFDKRGAIYCDRPRLIFGGELVGAGQLLAMNSCGPQWRAHRKLAHAVFNGAAVKKYHGTLEDIAALLNRALLDSPQDYYAHVRLSVC
jgi:cytochrome P450